jgi:hypothetical protein
VALARLAGRRVAESLAPQVVEMHISMGIEELPISGGQGSGQQVVVVERSDLDG